MEARQKKIKIALTGASKSGKSALASRYFKENYPPPKGETIGAAYFKKKLINKDVKLKAWDISGQPIFQGLKGLFTANVDVLLCCFDLNNKNSFAALDTNKNFDEHVVILVGTKSDLAHAVTEQEINTKMNELGCIDYFETSAQDNVNINELFEKAIDFALKKQAKRQNIDEETTADNRSTEHGFFYYFVCSLTIIIPLYWLACWIVRGISYLLRAKENSVDQPPTSTSSTISAPGDLPGNSTFKKSGQAHSKTGPFDGKSSSPSSSSSSPSSFTPPVIHH